MNFDKKLVFKFESTRLIWMICIMHIAYVLCLHACSRIEIMISFHNLEPIFFNFIFWLVISHGFGELIFYEQLNHFKWFCRRVCRGKTKEINVHIKISSFETSTQVDFSTSMYFNVRHFELIISATFWILMENVNFISIQWLISINKLSEWNISIVWNKINDHK